MSSQDIITIIGVSTGLVGAFAALATTYVAILGHKQNSYIIKVKAQRGWTVIGAVPPHEESGTYSVITVYTEVLEKLP